MQKAKASGEISLYLDGSGSKISIFNGPLGNYSESEAVLIKQFMNSFETSYSDDS